MNPDLLTAPIERRPIDPAPREVPLATFAEQRAVYERQTDLERVLTQGGIVTEADLLSGYARPVATREAVA